MGWEMELKMPGQSLRSPWISLIWGERWARRLAEGEEALRVRARIEKEEGEGEERRDSMQARPCLPVAPVMRRVLDMFVCGD